MDAPVDIDIPTHALSRGQNPYLDHCMYCSTPRTDSQDGDEGLELLGMYTLLFFITAYFSCRQIRETLYSMHRYETYMCPSPQ